MIQKLKHNTRNSSIIARYFAIISVCFFMSSCFKEEKKIAASTIDKTVIELKRDYSNQVYYNLATRNIVKTSDAYSWDLGFECASTGFHVILNGAKYMGIYNTMDTNFSIKRTIASVENLTVKTDVPSGNMDSTAIGNWGIFSTSNPISKKQVYIIHLGKNAAGDDYGYKKIQLLDYVNSYGIRYANLDGTGEQIAFISKDNTKRFVGYSLLNNMLVDNEPIKESWNLLFTRYTHIFSDTFPYPVTGVLLNPLSTFAAMDSITSFEQIDYIKAQQYTYSSAQDAIGYDWKSHSFGPEGTYTIRPIRYILKNTNGQFFKIEFIDFYNTQGVKGYPTFRIQEL